MAATRAPRRPARPAPVPVGRGPRGPYTAGRQARQSITDAAWEVFAARGFRAGSVREIADRARVSAANVIHHFGSKEALLVEVLRARDDRTGRPVLEQARCGDLLPALRALVRANAADPNLTRLFATAAADAADPAHPAHRYFQERYATVRSWISLGIERARATGSLPQGPDADLVATTMVAVLDGLQTQWLLDPDLDMPAAFDAHLLSLGAVLEETTP